MKPYKPQRRTCPQCGRPFIWKVLAQDRWYKEHREGDPVFCSSDCAIQSKERKPDFCCFCQSLVGADEVSYCTGHTVVHRKCWNAYIRRRHSAADPDDRAARLAQMREYSRAQRAKEKEQHGTP